MRSNAFLRYMNISVTARDARRIEVLAQDLPCFGGAQLAVDITPRCVLSISGEPRPGAAQVDGVVLMRAREDKETTNPELTTSGRCRLVVLAMETGGRCAHVVFRMCSVVCGVDVEPSGCCDTWCWTGGEQPSLADLLGRNRCNFCACPPCVMLWTDRLPSCCPSKKQGYVSASPFCCAISSTWKLVDKMPFWIFLVTFAKWSRRTRKVIGACPSAMQMRPC